LGAHIEGIRAQIAQRQGPAALLETRNGHGKIHEVTSVQKRAVEFFGQKINFFRGGNMKRPIATAFCLVVLLAGIAEPAAAYVGPGLGAGSIAVVLGIIGSLLLAIVGLV